MSGMTSKRSSTAAQDDTEVNDPSPLVPNAVFAGPDNQEFQYWIERHGLSPKHIKLLIPISEAQKISAMVKTQ
jgi:ABC-type nitrate/sulfonate/bicarbonate transport system substrate-binding protein